MDGFVVGGVLAEFVVQVLELGIGRAGDLALQTGQGGRADLGEIADPAGQAVRVQGEPERVVSVL